MLQRVDLFSARIHLGFASALLSKEVGLTSQVLPTLPSYTNLSCTSCTAEERLFGDIMTNS
jgi:hypothetical protein